MPFDSKGIFNVFNEADVVAVDPFIPLVAGSVAEKEGTLLIKQNAAETATNHGDRVVEKVQLSQRSVDAEEKNRQGHN